MKNSKSNRNTKSTNVARNAAPAMVAAPVQRSYSIVSPSGKIHTFSNVARFSSKYNLDRSAVSRVAQGIRGSHKGWTTPVAQ